jgi:tripartite-type tricarboxylate transporter receptor subunit TctC
MQKLSRRTLLAVALPALAARLARAQEPEDYPSRPVAFIVPYAPGGGTDALAHMLGEKLQQQLGQPFTVQSRPGEGTVIATNFVAKSPPDGYTIMMAVSTLAIDATLYKKLPYDAAKDLLLVALVASVPFVLVVNPSLQVYSVDDLIALAKQKPLSFGSGGIGAFHHLAGQLFASMTGIKLNHVPYRGTLPALNDLAAGYIQLMFTDYGPAQPLITAEKLRPLAVTTSKRLAALPTVPPLVDAGVPGFDIAAWQGVAVPAKTPGNIVLKLNAVLNTIVGTPDIRGRLRDLGMNPLGKHSPEELASFLPAEIVRWGKIVETAGLTKSE